MVVIHVCHFPQAAATPLSSWWPSNVTPTGRQWASRLKRKELNPATDRYIVGEAEKVIQVLRQIGEVAGVHRMIVTQSAPFKGYKDMYPTLNPQFEAGTLFKIRFASTATSYTQAYSPKMSALDVPPLATSSVFVIRSSIAISAPKQKVWDVLLDFPSYGEWNPYIRTQELISEEDKKPLTTQIAAPGLRIRLRLNLPPTMDDVKGSITEEILTHVDNDTFRFAWRFATPAQWLITAERWQVLRDDGPGGQATVYETWEFFGGLLAYLIPFFLGAKLQAAFDAMSHALKERAERAT